MTHRMTRRAFGVLGGAGLIALAAGRSARAAADNKTLRFIARTDLRVLDPLWTTAYVSRNHGYMIFDTLFALDSKFRPQPQMVGDYEISPGKLQYRFALRPGLKFHDGQPVRGADCVASLRRWMARDALGQALAASVDEITGGDGNALTIRLKEPFPLLLEGLAKVSSLVPFMMPERTAKTDPYQQITDTIGSGPFKFVREEFEPGHKAVYVKNPDYVPRDEPPEWASGGKVAKFDRVEWLVIAEPSTAAAALVNAEVDWWESPSPDLARVLATNPDLTVADTDPLGSMGLLRFKQLYPPFDNVKMRQAVLAVVDQTEYMTTLAGDPKDWKACASFFTCKTPMASDSGAIALTGKRDLAAAKRLIADARYQGEKIIILDGVDLLTNHIHALVTLELFKKLGLNAELATSDWGTVVTRRASKKPIAEGGWSVFGTDFTGVEMLNPWLNPPLPANGDKAWFGWPKDDRIEALRKEWLQAADSETRQEIATKIQERAFETVPYIPTGQYARRPLTAKTSRVSSSGRHCFCGTSRRSDKRPGPPAAGRGRLPQMRHIARDLSGGHQPHRRSGESPQATAGRGASIGPVAALANWPPDCYACHGHRRRVACATNAPARRCISARSFIRRATMWRRGCIRTPRSTPAPISRTTPRSRRPPSAASST